VLAGGLGGSSALADGDPASDVLITQNYYVPADANASAAQEDQLGSLLKAADRAGLPIRVAVIPAEYDLGSALQAWRRPQDYSEFLGYELSNSYKSALLIVMPNGFGLNWPDHSITRALRSLTAVAIHGGDGGLVTTAEAAVRAFAAAGGVRLAAGADSATPASSSASASHGIPTLAIVIVFAWALLIAAFVVVRRARRRPPGLAGAAPSRPVGAAQPRSRFALSRLAVLEGAAMSTALVLGVVLVVIKVTNQSSSDPAAGVNAPFLFHAGRRPAPAFTLSGQHGQPVTLAGYRGKPVIVTFIDPLCRNLCPLAAQRVPIIAVSVDVYADTPADLRQDFQRWGLLPQWTWAVGSEAQLAAVWRHYEVGVNVVTKSVAGITEHIVSHDELAYVVDPDGYERALFFWPYAPAGVKQVLAAVSRA